MTDPARLREADALLDNDRVFNPNPNPVREEGWVGVVVFLVLFTVVIFGIGRHLR